MHFKIRDQGITIINEIITLNIKEVIDPFNVLADYIDVLSYYNVQINSEEKNAIEINTKNMMEEDVSDIILRNYIKSILCEKDDHISKTIKIETNQFMNMTINTQKQLELTSTLKDQEYIGSLLWFLNKTNTAMGRRLLKKFIVHPLIDKETNTYSIYSSTLRVNRLKIKF